MGDVTWVISGDLGVDPLNKKIGKFRVNFKTHHLPQAAMRDSNIRIILQSPEQREK